MVGSYLKVFPTKISAKCSVPQIAAWAYFFIWAYLRPVLVMDLRMPQDELRQRVASAVVLHLNHICLIQQKRLIFCQGHIMPVPYWRLAWLRLGVTPEQAVPFLIWSCKGCVISDHIMSWLTMPKHRRRSETSLGWGMSTMALTLAGFLLTPSLLPIWPRYSSLVWENTHMSGLRIKSLLYGVSPLRRCSLFSAWFLPGIKMS